MEIKMTNTRYLYEKAINDTVKHGALLTANLLKNASVLGAVREVTNGTPEPGVSGRAAGAGSEASSGAAAEEKRNLMEDSDAWFDQYLGPGAGQYGTWGTLGLVGGSTFGLLNSLMNKKKHDNYLASILGYGLLGSALGMGGRLAYNAANDKSDLSTPASRAGAAHSIANSAAAAAAQKNKENPAT
jgi:hypothetical protein